MAEEIYEAGGRYATTLRPPLLACKRCGRVTRPMPGQTQIRCACGKVYGLLAEGHPVHVVPLR